MFCYCINPNCSQTKNTINELFCQGCHSELLLDSQYRVLEKLGNNNFIATYEVDEKGQRKILKVLYNYTEENFEIFKQQIDILANNSFSGIAKIEVNSYFWYFPEAIEKPLYCVVVEKLLGQTLTEWIKKRDNPIKEKLAINWLLELTRIIGKLHDKKIIHGNINPDHIILSPSGELNLTNLPSFPAIFTKGYAPREQEEGYLFPQSDFFALGRTFVYLLTSKEPLEFYDPYEDKLNWRKDNPILNNELGDYIDFLMARLPSNRPKNTASIIRRLGEIDRGFNVQLLIKQGVQKDLILPESLINSDANISDQKPTQNYQRKVKKRNKRKSKQFKFLRFVIKNWLKISLVIICTGIVTFQTYEYFSQKYSSNPLITVKSIVNLKISFGQNSGAISQLSFSPDGKNLASTGIDNVINIWDITDGEKINILEGHTNTVNAVAFSPDNRIIASGSADKTIKIWNAITGKEEKTLVGHNTAVTAIAFSRDGRILASASADGMILLWNRTNILPIATIFGHRDWVSSLAFSFDGNKLVSGSGDKTIKIWDVKTTKEIKTLDDHNLWISSVTFSPDGTIIASASGDHEVAQRDRTIKLWEAETGNLIKTLSGHNNWVTSVAFSRDGKYLASGSSDKEVKIWEVKTGELLNTFAGHTKKINSVVFSPVENILASGDDNGTINIWKID